jgi:hypothetical protein
MELRMRAPRMGSKERILTVPVNRGGIPPGSRTKDVASIRNRAEASAGTGLTV